MLNLFYHGPVRYYFWQFRYILR